MCSQEMASVAAPHHAPLVRRWPGTVNNAGPAEVRGKHGRGLAQEAKSQYQLRAGQEGSPLYKEEVAKIHRRSLQRRSSRPR